MCVFFHASNLLFENGLKRSVNDYEGNVTYNHKNRTGQDQLINEMLNDARPNGVISRLKCIYLFRDLELCKSYARSEKIAHVYEVSANDNVFGPYPMCLLTTLLRCEKEKKTKVISEYWNPHEKWHILEYLTSSITIQNEVLLERGGHNLEPFIHDLKLSKKILLI